MPKVTYKNNGQSADGGKGQCLREVTQKAGWDIPYACENGICGTCIVKISDEEKEYLDEIEEQEMQTLQALGAYDGNHRLACQCHLKDQDVTIEH